MRVRGNGHLVIFATGILFVTCTIRSGIIVDKSFLPRFLFLSLFLLISYIISLRNKVFLQKNFFEISFVLFYIWNLLSCIWATSPPEAIMQSQLVFLSLALFWMVSAFIRRNTFFESIFIKTLLLVLILSFVLAFYKMSSLQFYDPYKIISISANNNLYSGFLLLSLPFLFTGYSLHKGFWKYLSILTAIGAIFFILIIQSRAVYLGLFIAVLIAFFLLICRYRHVFTRMNIIVGIVSVFLLLGSVFVFYSSLDNIRQSYFLSKIPVWRYFRPYDLAAMQKLRSQRIVREFDHGHIPAFDFSEDYYENVGLRYVFWKKSLCLIRSHPFAGVGAGNWRLIIPSCIEPANPEHTLKNYTYSQPHNEFICIISELGIIGFILALIIVFIPPGIALYRILFEARKLPIAVVFYASFIIGFYVFSSFDFPLKRVEHNVLLFSMFAFLIYKVPLNKKEENHLVPLFSGKLFSALFALLLLFSLFISLARIKGEFYTLKMFMYERKDDDKVIYYCRKAENMFYRITPNTLPLAWFEGVAYYRKGDIGSAVPCFERALESTPYEVRVLNDYGISLFNLKKSDQAKNLLLKSIDIDPYFDDAKFNLGAIYYFEGQKDSARYYITRCRDSRKKKEFLEELR